MENLWRDGAHVDRTMASRYRALLRSAHEGDAVQVRMCLLDGLDVNHVGKGVDLVAGTALQCAAENGRSTVVRALLAHPGIDVNATDPRGWTALHLAAEVGAADVVALLLKQPELDWHAQTRAGKTAWMLAREGGHHRAAFALAPRLPQVGHVPVAEAPESGGAACGCAGAQKVSWALAAPLAVAAAAPVAAAASGSGDSSSARSSSSSSRSSSSSTAAATSSSSSSSSSSDDDGDDDDDDGSGGA